MAIRWSLPCFPPYKGCVILEGFQFNPFHVENDLSLDEFSNIDKLKL